MILLQFATGSLGVMVVYFVLSSAEPSLRLGFTIAAAVAYSLLSQLTIAEKRERFYLALVIVPLFLFLAVIGGLGWYAQNSDPLKDEQFKKGRELLLSSGMIKDALYTVSLNSLEIKLSDDEKQFAPAANDTSNGYAFINGSFETPYNGTGIYLFLEYTGADSMVLSGLSARLSGRNDAFANSGGYTGCLQYRAVVKTDGITITRVN